MKKCRVCKEVKSLHDFYNLKRSKDGKESRCISCDKEARRKYRENNREHVLRLQREQNWKRCYGITREEYMLMWNSQSGKCKICTEPMTDIEFATERKRTKSRACVDHDHDTGKVRGLLCGSCNRGLGFFNDSETLIESALKYLRKYQCH